MTISHSASYTTNNNEEIMENGTLENKSVTSASICFKESKKTEEKLSSQHI